MKKGILGLGVYDFREVFDKNFFYIDKTYFLKEWLDNGDVVTLITRPRRFGKTLTMSMVEHFLSDRYKEDRTIFENLYIGSCGERYMKHQASAAVINLSFTGIKGEDFNKTYTRIRNVISRLYKKFDYLLNTNSLDEYEKEYFNRIYREEAGMVDYEMSLLNLSTFLYKYTDKKVYILLDEYDTPLQNAYVKGYWNQLMSFIMSFFVNTFKVNNSLNRAIITGITRVSKESIFSDLNNLRVITTTSKSYASCFGFTEEEVSWALDSYNLSDEKENVKKYYNGFLMGDNISVYNPWSIVNYLANRKYDDYWANTSSNMLIKNVIAKSSPLIKLDMENLLRGGSVYSELKEDIVYSDLDTSPDISIWSLLLATGYVKVCSYNNYVYELQITNMEVMNMFNKMFKEWFYSQRYEYSEFITALLCGDEVGVEECLNELALAMFSMFDTANGDSRRAPENFYHGFVLGMLVDLKDRYIIESNRESGLGRYDIMMIPRNTKDDVGCIIEFKVFSPRKEKDMQQSLKNALNQIEDKKYELILKEHGVSKIYKYGIVFKGKECIVGLG